MIDAHLRLPQTAWTCQCCPSLYHIYPADKAFNENKLHFSSFLETLIPFMIKCHQKTLTAWTHQTFSIWALRWVSLKAIDSICLPNIFESEKIVGSSNIRDLQSIKLATCRYLASCRDLRNCQTERQMSAAHIISTLGNPCNVLFYPDFYSPSSRLVRSWKCQRTSPRQRRGRTRSSARWTRTWTENSPSKSLLRFGLVPFLSISFVRGNAREGNLANVV